MITRRSLLFSLPVATALANTASDAAQDRTTLIFEGKTPNKLCCDTTLRLMPDGSWIMFMLGGGDSEPLPQNDLFLSRSTDEGKTWSPMTRIALGIKEKDTSRALVPTEMVIHKGECWLYFANHDGRFRDWTTWCVKSKDSCRTWGKPEPIPAPIHTSTFVRNSYVRPNGELLIAYQHYLSPDGPKNPRNGIMISKDGGRTWSKAAPTDIPNPGSKITLYSLGGENVALLHNPNPKVRNPLSLWVSFDGMKT
jgi:predicted neuraminidase